MTIKNKTPRRRVSAAAWILSALDMLPALLAYMVQAAALAGSLVLILRAIMPSPGTEPAAAVPLIISAAGLLLLAVLASYYASMGPRPADDEPASGSAGRGGPKH